MAIESAPKKLRDFAEKAKVFFIKYVLPIALPVLKVMGPPVGLGLAVFLILYLTGLGAVLNNSLTGLTGVIPAALVIFAVSFIPVISSLLGPGLLIAVAAAVLTGEQIAAGAVIPLMALPVLLVIDAQIGNNFIPPGFSLGINEPETINAGVPGIVFTRLITVSAAVLLACFLSF